jgi:hypothetical protein
MMKNEMIERQYEEDITSTTQSEQAIYIMLKSFDFNDS